MHKTAARVIVAHFLFYTCAYLFISCIRSKDLVLVLREEHVGALEAFWSTWGLLELELLDFLDHFVVAVVVVVVVAVVVSVGLLDRKRQRR